MHLFPLIKTLIIQLVMYEDVFIFFITIFLFYFIFIYLIFIHFVSTFFSHEISSVIKYSS